MLKLVNKEGREALVVEGSRQHEEFLVMGFEVEVEKKTTRKKTTKSTDEDVSIQGDKRRGVRI